MRMDSTYTSNNIAKVVTTNDYDKSNKDKHLPDTGEQVLYNSVLLGGLFAGVGSLFLLGRQKKKIKKNIE